MKRSSLLVCVTLLTAFTFVPSVAAGQSMFAVRGLGFPIEPLDARSRGLGGIALGFPEAEISWANPAAAVGIAAPGVVVGYQYDNFGAAADEADDHQTARFPLILAAFPAGDRLTFMAGYGSYLDQNWRIEKEDSLMLGGESVAVTDRITSEGGVIRLRLGAAYGVIESVDVGIGVDFFSGEVERVQGRFFADGFDSGPSRAGWTYGGQGFTGSAKWSPNESSGVAASVSYGGTLDATPEEGGAVALGESARAAAYELPLLFRAGAGGRVGQTTLVALGASWDGWSSLDEAFAADGGARDSWSVQGGIEWDGLIVRDRPTPIRVGARTATLPFRWSSEAGVDWAKERALTVGAGLHLAEGAVHSDFAFEFGDRGGESAGLEESFWRFAFSLRVLGR